METRINGKNYPIEKKIVNGTTMLCISNITLAEWTATYGDDEDMWDFPMEDIEDGAVEINEDLVYCIIDGRAYETDIVIG